MTERATSRLALMTKVWQHIKTNDIRDENGNLVQVDQWNYKELCYLYEIPVPEVIYTPDGAAERKRARAAEMKPKFIEESELTEEEKLEREERRSEVAPD